MNAEDIRKAKERIAKLMNMTEANGCTEDEAASAMSMAAGLAARMGISMDSVRPADAPKIKINVKRKDVELKIHQALCGEAAGFLYGVEFNAPNFGKNGFWFIGRPDNIELAENTMLWLVRQVELLYKRHLPKGLTQKARAEYRRTFKEACALRVRDRAWTLMRTMKQDDAAATAATGSNALVVAGHFQQLASEIQDYWDERMGMGKYMTEERKLELAQAKAERAALEAEYVAGTKRRPKEQSYKAPRGRSIRTGNGTNTGFAAGDNVKLRQEVS